MPVFQPAGYDVAGEIAAAGIAPTGSPRQPDAVVVQTFFHGFHRRPDTEYVAAIQVRLHGNPLHHPLGQSVAWPWLRIGFCVFRRWDVSPLVVRIGVDQRTPQVNVVAHRIDLAGVLVQEFQLHDFLRVFDGFA